VNNDDTGEAKVTAYIVGEGLHRCMTRTQTGVGRYGDIYLTSEGMGTKSLAHAKLFVIGAPFLRARLMCESPVSLGQKLNDGNACPEHGRRVGWDPRNRAQAEVPSGG